MIKKDGFTLIELLVVITIIAILAVVGFAMYGTAASKAKDAKRRSDIDAIVKAFETNFDPIKGVYKAFSGSDFTGGKIPTPPEGNSYDFIALGPAGGPYKGFKMCAKLQPKVDSKNNLPCIDNSAVCYCKESAQGEKVSALAVALTTDDGSFNQYAGGSSYPTPVSYTTPASGGGAACTGCSPDINGDGTVNDADYNLFSACYNKDTSVPGCLYVDLNSDISINRADFDIFNTQYPSTIQKNLVCENFGDLSKDNKLTMSDVRILSDKVSNSTLSNEEKVIGDVNYTPSGGSGIGFVDSNDIQHLQQYLNGQIVMINACLDSSVRTPPCDGMGDVSTDGKVTYMDAQEALRVSIVGDSLKSIYTGAPYTGDQKIRANVADPASSPVNGGDSLQILRFVDRTYQSFQSCPKDSPCSGYGDVDSDGKVTDIDRNKVSRNVNRLEVFSDEQKERADVNNDGVVSAVDVSLIRSYLLGYGTTANTFPAVCPQ